VYEPAVIESTPDVRASLAFYRGKIKADDVGHVNVIDAAAGKFVFPRLAMLVR
jgi:hypothetical protein